MTWKVEVEVSDDGAMIVVLDPQLPPNTGTMVTEPLRARFTSDGAVALARRILAAHAKHAGADPQEPEL